MEKIKDLLSACCMIAGIVFTLILDQEARKEATEIYLESK